MSFISYDQFLFEAKKQAPQTPKDEERTALILDGTSSAGKSYTAKNSGVKSKGRWKTDDKGNFVKDKKGNFIKADYAGDEFQTIALDDYWGNDPLDKKDSPENQARWDLEKNDPFYTDKEREFSKKYGDTFAHIGKDYKKTVTEWNAAAKKKLKSGKDEDGNDLSEDDIKGLKDEIKGYEDRLRDWPKPARNHPDWDAAKKKAKKAGHKFRENEPHRFFMMQEYKQSKNKNIMFDDITGDVSQFLPDGATKTVLLHAPMDKLMDNIERREKDDARDPKHVFDDYVTKYQFTKEKPSEATGQPGKPIKKKDILAMLKKAKDKNKFSQSTIDDEWIENFTKSMGLDDDKATYYMKVKDDYIKQNEPVIVNADEDNQKTFKAFKEVVDKEQKRVQEGKKKVGDDLKKEAEKEIKTIDDVGTGKLFAGMDPKLAEKLQKMKVTVVMPGRKKKQIQTGTLMDFVPIDTNDPEEQAMIKAQAAQYMRINALRIKQKLEPLIDFEMWMKRSIELAKDNKDYQARVKAKTMKKMKSGAVKEGQIPSFDHFLAEEENNRRFEAIVSGLRLLND